MAVWSQISTSDLVGAVRLDAEFWQPSYLVKEKKIRIKEHVSLGGLVSTFKKGIFYILAREYADSGVPFYRSSNVGAILPKEMGITFITERKHKEEYKTALVNGDLMIVKTGKSGASIVLQDRCNVSQDVIAVKVRRERVNPYYLAVYLNTSFGSSEMNRWFQGQVQPHLSLEDARRIWVPLIASSEQQKIEELVLGSALAKDAGERAWSTAQQLLESELGLDKLSFQRTLGYTAQVSDVVSEKRMNAEYFSPLIKQILSNKIFIDAKPLTNYFSIIRGQSTNKYLDEGIAVLKTKNIRTPSIDHDRVNDFAGSTVGLTAVQEGDLIFASMGVGSLGRISFTHNLPRECVIDGTLRLLRRKFDAPINIELPYLLFLSTRAGQELIYRGIIGSTGIISLPDEYLGRILLPNIPDNVCERLTELVIYSMDAGNKSKELLEQAKNRVEQLIEEAVKS